MHFIMFYCTLYKVLADTRITKSADRRSVELNPDQWELIELLVGILQPFKEATEILSADQYVSLSLAESIIGKLLKCVGGNTSDNEIICAFTKKLQTELKERFLSNDTDVSLILLSAIVDPRYKRLKYTESEKLKDKAKHALVQKVQNIMSKPVATSPSASPPKKKQRVSATLLDSSSSDDDEVPLACASTALTSLHEVERYLKEPKCGKNANPLHWWRDHESQFPTVSQVARQLLCTPATSTPSERVFSTAGNIASVKRSMLKPQNLNALIFLAHNKW